MLATGAGTAAAIFYAAHSVEGRSEDALPQVAEPMGRTSAIDPDSDAPQMVTGSIGARPPQHPAHAEPDGDATPTLSVFRAGDSIRVTGAVGDLSALDDFRAAAREAFPTAGLEASLRAEPDLEAGVAQAGLAAVAALSRFAEGEAHVADRLLSIEGRALYPQTETAVRERLSALTPPGWRLELVVDEPEAVEEPAATEPPAVDASVAQCEGRLSSALSQAPIAFAVASASIADESGERLDSLAEILKSCGEVAVEIGGHTDSDGPEAANARISQARADAVRDALAARGVDAGRLAAVGYGEARPVAPNDTPENKALNRRIEIVVQR